jgi:hypothetical protein
VVGGLNQLRRLKKVTGKRAVLKLIGLVVGGLVQYKRLEKRSCKEDWSSGWWSCSI